MERARVAEVLYAKILATTEDKWHSMDGSGPGRASFKQLGGVDLTDDEAEYASQAWRVKQVLGRPEPQPPEETAADRRSRLARNLLDWCARMGIPPPVGANATACAHVSSSEETFVKNGSVATAATPAIATTSVASVATASAASAASIATAAQPLAGARMARVWSTMCTHGLDGLSSEQVEGVSNHRHCVAQGQRR